MRTLYHLLLATILSFGLSLAFWALFDVFQIGPFWIISSTAALIGAIAGRFSSRYFVTIVTTILLRGAIFAMAILA